MLHTISTVYDDIQDKIVMDLGCGTGILGIAASLLGAQYLFAESYSLFSLQLSTVVGVDIDADALQVAQQNCEELEVENMEFILSDVTQLNLNAKRKQEFE